MTAAASYSSSVMQFTEYMGAHYQLWLKAFWKADVIARRWPDTRGYSALSYLDYHWTALDKGSNNNPGNLSRARKQYTK